MGTFLLDSLATSKDFGLGAGAFSGICSFLSGGGIFSGLFTAYWKLEEGLRICFVPLGGAKPGRSLVGGENAGLF